MSKKKAREILYLQLEWIKNADSKVSPLFAIDVAMLGALVALASAKTCWNKPSIIFTSLSTGFLLLSVIALAIVMFPRLRGPNDSILYFGGITKKKKEKFIKQIQKSNSQIYEIDLLSQAYRNAEIAKSKYVFVKIAFILTFISVPFWLISIYVLYI